MAMNKREKILAAGVGGVVALFAGQYGIESVRSGYSEKQKKIDDLTATKSEQELQQLAGSIASQKLNIVAARSLPKSEEKAIADYQAWLIELAEKANLTDPVPQFTGGVRDVRDKEKTYQKFDFRLSGSGTIADATKLLYTFYEKDYLHRITSFDLKPSMGQKETGQLNIVLNCEVLALAIAKDKQPPPTKPSQRVTKSLEEYNETILNRNLFSPKNNPPQLAAKKSLEAKIGLPLEHTFDAKDPDPSQSISYEVVGEAPKGLMVDSKTGKLTWSSKELGEFKVSVKATDSGIPARSTTQDLTINVKELPPPPKEAPKFDIASQSYVTAFIVSGKSPPEAWVLSRTEDKRLYLKIGDQLKLGGVEGKIVEIGANFMEVETEGKKWLVGLDENLAEAYNRGMVD
jgi:hypothetical protein